MRQLVVTGAFAVFIAACTIMNGLTVPDPGSGTSGGGDDDDDDATGARDSGADRAVSPAGCALKHPPAKPPPSAGGSDTSFSIAMRDMLSDNQGPAIGLDQDGLCTCADGEPEACKSPTDTAHCDPPNGLDNAGSTLFRGLTGAPVPINVIEDANKRIEQGVRGNLFKIQGYNGTANDDSVTVTYYPSPGLGQPPNFEAVQTWPVASSSVTARDAWVAGNELVALFDSMEIYFLDETNAPAKMKSATLTGTVVKGTDGPTMGTALLVGRVNTTELVQGVGQLEPSSVGFALCQTGTAYKTLAASACTQSDLPATPAEDGTAAACSSLSMTLELRFVPAIVGSTANLRVIPSRCAPEDLVTCP